MGVASLWWARWLLCAFGDRSERIGDRKIKGNAAAVEGDWGGVLIVWVRPDELPDGWMDGWIGVVALILVGVRHSSTARTRDRGMHRVLSMYAHSLASERHRYPTVLPATYHLDIVSVPPCHLTKDQTRLILAAGPLPLALLKNRETLSSSSSARSLLSLTPSRSRSLHHAAHSPYL